MKTQKGFAILEGLLVLIIIGMLAGIGWYVLKASKSTNNTLSQTNNSSVKPTKKTEAAKDNTKYLTIKEWGVRVPYKSEDTLSYTYRSPNADNIGSIDVVSKKLADSFGCKDFGAGLIGRQNADDPMGDVSTSAAQQAKNHPDLYKQVGNYVYSFAHDQAACADNPTQASADAENVANAFTKTLIPAIELIQ